MKNKIIAIFLMLTLSIFTGCETVKIGANKTKDWVVTHKPQFQATGKWVVGKVIDIVNQVVIPVAISQLDKSKKQDIVDGLASGFRTYQGTGKVLTSSDIQSIVEIWTPDKSHWEELGLELSDLWAKQNPKNPEEVQKLLEEFAKGLNVSTGADTL